MRTWILLVFVIGLSSCGAHRFGEQKRLDASHYTFKGPRPVHRPSDPHGQNTPVSATLPEPDTTATTQEQPPVKGPEQALSRLVDQVSKSEENIQPAALLAAEPIALEEESQSDPEPVLQEELPERTEWNWLAVAAPIILIITLIAAIPAQSTELLLLGCLAALAAALIGARQCRDKGQKGQGFALAVMGLAAAGAVIALLALLSRAV